MAQTVAWFLLPSEEQFVNTVKIGVLSWVINLRRMVALKILLIGGTNFVGRAIGSLALEQGCDVSFFNRGRSPCDLPVSRRIVGDVNQLGDFAAELRGECYDVVIHCIAYTEQHGKDLREIFKGTSTRLIVISSIDCYEGWQGLNRRRDLAELPITEASPISKMRYYWSDTETKGEYRYTYDKNLLTDIVMAGCAAGEYEATTFRLPLIWGPRDHQVEGRHGPFIQRILAGRKTIVLSDREQCQVYSHGYSENIAAAILHSLTQSVCSGKIYNIGEKVSYSRRRWLELYGEVLGWEFDVKVLPEELLRRDLAYRFAPPQHMLVSTDAFHRETGFEPPVSLTAAIEATFAYFKANPEALGPTPDYAAEDALVSRYVQALDALHPQ